MAGAAGGLPELHYQSQFHSNRRYGGDWYYKFGERDGFLRLGVDTVRTYGGQAGLLPLVGLRLPLPHRQVLEITYLRDLSSQILQLHLGGVAANVAGTEIAIPAITSNMPSFKTLPAERQTNAGLIGLAGRHIRHDTVQTDAWLHLRLTINTVLSSMRSSSLICCRYSSCFTACSRIALQSSFAGSSLCSRITRSICSRSGSSLPS